MTCKDHSEEESPWMCACTVDRIAELEANWKAGTYLASGEIEQLNEMIATRDKRIAELEAENLDLNRKWAGTSLGYVKEIDLRDELLRKVANFLDESKCTWFTTTKEEQVFHEIVKDPLWAEILPPPVQSTSIPVKLPDSVSAGDIFTMTCTCGWSSKYHLDLAQAQEALEAHLKKEHPAAKE